MEFKDLIELRCIRNLLTYFHDMVDNEIIPEKIECSYQGAIVKLDEYTKEVDDYLLEENESVTTNKSNLSDSNGELFWYNGDII